jgi:uncharacterized protein YceK
MSQQSLVFTLVAIFLLQAASGCGTIASIDQNEPFPDIVYGGVQNELSPVSPHTVLDIPFSAIADTIVLPYTIPQSFYNEDHPEEKPTYDKNGERIRN